MERRGEFRIRSSYSRRADLSFRTVEEERRSSLIVFEIYRGICVLSTKRPRDAFKELEHFVFPPFLSPFFTLTLFF